MALTAGVMLILRPCAVVNSRRPYRRTWCRATWRLRRRVEGLLSMGGGAMTEQEREAPARRLSLPLLAGMLTVPVLFVWLFLRRGYTASLRRAAFFYTAVTLAIG